MSVVGPRLVVVEGAAAAAVLAECIKPMVVVAALGAPLHRRAYERVDVFGVARHRLTAAQKRWLAQACAVNATVEFH